MSTEPFEQVILRCCGIDVHKDVVVVTRYRNKLIQHVSLEKNRIVRILEDCNIKPLSVSK